VSSSCFQVEHERGYRAIGYAPIVRTGFQSETSLIVLPDREVVLNEPNSLAALVQIFTLPMASYGETSVTAKGVDVAGDKAKPTSCVACCDTGVAFFLANRVVMMANVSGACWGTILDVTLPLSARPCDDHRVSRLRHAPGGALSFLEEQEREHAAPPRAT